MIAVSDPVFVTAIVAGFFLLLALVVVARSFFTRAPPSTHRFRIGIFVERDDRLREDEPEQDDQQPPSP